MTAIETAEWGTSSHKSKSKSKSKSSKSTKRSKIDKPIELKIELIKLLLVAAEIATEAEVEDMTPDELLGLMLDRMLFLGGSLEIWPASVGFEGGLGKIPILQDNFGNRFLNDVAEDVDMDMDTVTVLLKEMLEDMI